MNEQQTPIDGPTEENIDSTLKQSFFESEFFKRTTQGLISSLPFVIILFVISAVFNMMLRILSPISQIFTPGSEKPGLIINFFSLLMVILIFFFIGKIVNGAKGRRLVNKFERDYLMNIPLYSTVKELVQQFTGVKKMPFSRVVLVDPFNNGVLMTGFVTDDTSKDMITVFVPTAPNPTNGFVFHVPVDKLKFVPSGADVAMRSVIGMGTGSSYILNGVDTDPSPIDHPASEDQQHS